MVLSSAYPHLSAEPCHETGSQLRKYLLATVTAMRRNIFALYIEYRLVTTSLLKKTFDESFPLSVFCFCSLGQSCLWLLPKVWLRLGCKLCMVAVFSQVNGRRCEKKQWVHAWCMPFLFVLVFAIAFVRWSSEKSFNLFGTLVQLVSSVPGPANSAGCPGSWLLWWESWDLCWALQGRKPQLHERVCGLWNCRLQEVYSDLYFCKFYGSEVPLWIVLAFDSIMLMLLMSVILLCRPQEFQWLVDDWHDDMI